MVDCAAANFVSFLLFRLSAAKATEFSVFSQRTGCVTLVRQTELFGEEINRKEKRK